VETHSGWIDICCFWSVFASSALMMLIAFLLVIGALVRLDSRGPDLFRQDRTGLNGETDNGIQFTTPGGGGSAVPLVKEAMANGERLRAHAFEYACARNDIDHRTTKLKHPWTNGQVERMNRTIKEATIKRFHHETHDQLREHLVNFVAAYNCAKRLKTRKGLTPCEYICKCWTKEPQRMTSYPYHQTPGPNKANALH
jgi:hypothetical protein